MSLIIQNWYCTEENGKLKYAKECFQSLMDTVRLDNNSDNRVVIINQNSCVEAKKVIDWINEYTKVTVIDLKENIGTARGINIGLRMRKPNEFVIKTDEDLTWNSSGWVEAMEEEIKNNPTIGILGLKRDDVEGEIIEDGNLLWSHDIFGTCTMFNPLMLARVGYSYQPSNYGFEDVLMSVRSEAAGFKNAFMKDIKITNLDTVGTEYTEWKKREAGIYLNEVGAMCELIKNGELSYYYGGE